MVTENLEGTRSQLIQSCLVGRGGCGSGGKDRGGFARRVDSGLWSGGNGAVDPSQERGGRGGQQRKRETEWGKCQGGGGKSGSRWGGWRGEDGEARRSAGRRGEATLFKHTSE
jgi:hypothetical protein